jgi:CRISPR/Cas system CSM-associated protein Csm3 (group 7 of RAMP superfamily)
MTDGKIVLEGIIELISPALIGSGSDEHSDCDVILGADGKPFIPATSFLGVLKHHIKLAGYDDELKQFWGFTEGDKGSQSSIICSDLYCKNDAKIIVRDGIKIDNKTGIVEKKDKTGMKYDYEVVEKGAEFKLRIEINFSDETRAFYEQMASTICNVLKEGKISIGAKTNSGLGRIELKNEKCHEYHFNNKTDVFNWLMGKDGNSFSATPFPVEKPRFTIDATLKLKNSFIIRSYSEDANAPDSTSIKSGKDYVITGTSLKGAIRSRAERIANTLGKTRIIENLFGYVKEKDPSDKAKKGRIQIDEVTLPDLTSEVQTRIKIDRFTGGVMEGALLETMPLFKGKDDKVFEIKITIRDCQPHEAGLMLLILKDLWTGDLPIGGEKAIGRGVLKGKSAEIIYNGKTYRINEDLSISPEDGIRELQGLVNAITQKSVSAEEVCHA